MKRIISIFSLLFCLSLWATPTILTLDNYREIGQKLDQFVDDETIVVFDIDDTLVRIPTRLTEKTVAGMINDLQDHKIDTMALTARMAILIGYTRYQLNKVNIDFDGHPFDSSYDFTRKMPSSKSLYFRSGVAYAGGGSKGNALKLFQDEIFPASYKKIVFIDDNIKNINSVNRSFQNDEQAEVLIVHYTRYN